jgi:hypothetical protein
VTRETARQELEALDGRRKKIEEIGHDKDALLESYAAMVPEGLDALAPEEPHRVHKTLRLRVLLRPDASAGGSGAIPVATQKRGANAVTQINATVSRRRVGAGSR